MPRFNHRDGRKRDYLRGFGCQFWYTGAQTDLSYAKSIPGFGLDFKKAVKERYPALLALHPFGETIPKAENRITVKGSPLDQYGVPIARISYTIGENERRMSKDMYDTMLEILHAAKAEIVPYEQRPSGAKRQRNPRARHLPHGRGSEALRAERLLPDARREECVCGGRIGVHDGFGKESDADDPGSGLARDRLHGWRNEARQYLELGHGARVERRESVGKTPVLGPGFLSPLATSSAVAEKFPAGLFYGAGAGCNTARIEIDQVGPAFCERCAGRNLDHRHHG